MYNIHYDSECSELRRYVGAFALCEALGGSSRFTTASGWVSTSCEGVAFIGVKKFE